MSFLFSGRHKTASPQQYAALGDPDIEKEDAPKSARLSKFVQPLAFFILGIVFATALSAFRNGDFAASQSLTIKTPVPEMPLMTVIFESNETYQARPTFENDVAWNSLLPLGRGFVFVKDPEQYALPPGEQTEWGPIYSVAMFHQLHCLGQIRKAYWMLLEGAEDEDFGPSKLLLGPRGSHVHHCLDYLRQSVMCAGDMSLEWPREKGAGEGFAVDGWGVPHQCKSWDAIWDYMDEVHFNNSASIDIAG